jgi:hypothetical protein
MAVKKPSRAVTLPWLNEGKETKLGAIPIKGDQRLEMLRTEGADIVAQDYQAWMCHLRGSLIAVKDLIKTQGVGDAQKQWMIAFGEYDNLRWDEESFESSLDVAIQDYVFTPLKVSTIKEAEDAIEAEAKALNRKSNPAFAKRRKEWQQESRLEEVFWMLWRADPRPSFMPDPNKVPSEADIQAARDHLATFLDDDSYAAMFQAYRGVNKLTANLEALTSPMTTEMVQGKASSTSKH